VGTPQLTKPFGLELLRRSTISAAELDARVSKEWDALASNHEAPNDIGPCVRRPKYLLLDELGELPDPNDFVEDLLCDGQLSVIYGAPNAGKSFFALDLALRVAFGWKWFGKDVERGAVIYVAAEGGGGMKRRVAAFLRGHGVEQTQGLPFALIPYTVDFRDKRSIEGLIEIAQEISEQFGIPVRWIIVDTLSRALAGGDENSSTDMGALVRGADRVRTATGAHLSLVHHAGKDHARGARGHSLLLGAADTEIEIKRHDRTSGVIEMNVTKQRDLEIGRGFAFKLERVDLGKNARGKPVTSCVVEAAIVKPDLTETEQEAIEILNTMLHESDEAYVDLSAWREAILSRGDLVAGQRPDTRRTQWQRLRKSLEKKGFIERCDNKVAVKNG
jgi:AAA domain